MIAEGAGAAPLAAVMFNKLPVKGKKVVCVMYQAATLMLLSFQE